MITSGIKDISAHIVLILTCFDCLQCLARTEYPNDCDPVKVKVYIEGRICISDNTTCKQLIQLLRPYIESLKDTSKIDVSTFQGRSIQKEANFGPKQDGGDLFAMLEAGLHDVSNRSSGSGAAVSSRALEQDLSSYFLFELYKDEAEIVVFFVTHFSQLDGVPKHLLKKKTIVVYFGSSPSEQWTTVASRQDHLIVVDSTVVDLGHVNKMLINITCIDSKLYCDTDRFSDLKGARCKNCSEYACVRMDSLTCKSRCPYFNNSNVFTATEEGRAITKNQTEKTSTERPIGDSSETKSSLTVGLTVLVCVALVVPILLVTLVYGKPHQNSLLHFDSIPLITARRNAPVEQRKPFIRESAPQQEASGREETPGAATTSGTVMTSWTVEIPEAAESSGTTMTSGAAESSGITMTSGAAESSGITMTSGAAESSGTTMTSGAAGISGISSGNDHNNTLNDEEAAAALLKNEEERKMNVHATSLPPFVDLRVNKVRETIV